MSDQIQRSMERAAARARLRRDEILPDPEPSIRRLESRFYAGLIRIQARVSQWSSSMGSTIGSFLDRDGSRFDRFTRRVGVGFGTMTFLAQKLGSIGQSVFSAVTGKVSLLGNAIVLAIGALGGLVVGLPAFLTALGVSAAAVALGLDGIKRAAQVAKPALDALKVAVSDSFEKSLRPAMVGISQILPQLEGGLRANATALGNMATRLVEVTNTGPGIAALSGFINQTARATEALTPHIVAGQQAFLRLLQVAGPIMPQLAEGVGSLASEWAAAIQRMANTGVLRDSLVGLAAVLKSTGSLFGQLMEVIGRLSATLGGPAAQLIQAISDGFAKGQGDVSRFGAALGRIVSAIAPMVARLIPIVLRFAASFAESVAPAIERAAPAIDAFLRVLESMAGPLGTIVGMLAVLGGAMKVFTVLRTVVSVIRTVVQVLRLWAIAQTIINFLLTANPIGIIVVAIGALVAGLILAYRNSETFRNVVDGAFRAVGNAVQSVIGFFSDLGAKVGAGVQAAMDWFRRLPETVGNAVRAVIDFLTDLPNKAAFALGYLAGMVYNGARAAWRFLSETIPEYVGQAVAYVQALPGRIGAFLAALAAVVIARARMAWSNFLNTTRTFIAQAVAFVQALPGRVGSFLASLPGIVRNAASSAWQGFLSTTRNLAQQALAFVQSIPGKIRGFFSGAGQWLLQAGKDIITGLWNGLKAMAQAVLDWIKNLGSQIAAGFKSAVGVRSPSTIFDGAGRDIMHGLRNGLESQRARVLGTVDTLGRQMVARWQAWAARVRAIRASVGGGGGGMVQAEDGSWVPRSFYGGGGTVARRPARGGGMVRAEDGSLVPRSFYSGAASRMDPAPVRRAASAAGREAADSLRVGFTSQESRIVEAYRRVADRVRAALTEGLGRARAVLERTGLGGLVGAILARVNAVIGRRPPGSGGGSGLPPGRPGGGGPPTIAVDSGQAGAATRTGVQAPVRDLDGISDAVRQGVYDGVAESLGPVSNEGLVRAVRKGEAETGRL